MIDIHKTAGAGVLSALEGPHEQQTCEKAKSLFNDGVAEKAAQEIGSEPSRNKIFTV